MLDNIERHVEHLDLVREDLLPLLVVELDREGLIAVDVATVKENASESFIEGEITKDE